MTTKAALVALCLPGMAQAVTCRDDIFEDASYSVCEVAPGEDLRLFLNGPDGPYGSFAALVTGLEPTGLTLDFAMNAGMFHEDLAPVGLYIENFQQKARIVTSDGPGNFGLLPNGVFCVGDSFAVIESRAFKAAPRPAAMPPKAARCWSSTARCIPVLCASPTVTTIAMALVLPRMAGRSLSFRTMR